MDHARIQTAFFLGLFTIVLVLNFLIFKPYFAALFIALTLAVIFFPVYEKILSYVKSERAASLLTTLLVFLIVLLPIVFFSQKLFVESKDLYTSLSNGQGNSFLDTLVSRIRGLNPNIVADLNEYARNAASSIFQNFGAIFSSVARIIFTFILMLTSLYFFLKDGKTLRTNLYALSPLPRDVDESIVQKMGSAINSIIRGQLVVAILQGLIAMAGLAMFGVPNPVLWGSLVIVAALIPTAGTALVMIPAIAYLYFNGQTFSAIGLAIWSVTAIGLLDNFLGPILINRGLKIHPFVVLLSVIGGISAFGMVGFILGPLILTLLIALFQARGVLIKK